MASTLVQFRTEDTEKLKSVQILEKGIARAGISDGHRRNPVAVFVKFEDVACVIEVALAEETVKDKPVLGPGTLPGLGHPGVVGHNLIHIDDLVLRIGEIRLRVVVEIPDPRGPAHGKLISVVVNLAKVDKREGYVSDGGKSVAL